MQQPSKTCARCGKVFFKDPNTSAKAWNEQVKYCSRTCYWVDKSKPPQKTCPTCGKAFKTKDWRTAAKYCSKACLAIAQSQERTMPRQSCEVCGKVVARARARFCSRECKVIWYRGENVYNYLGEEARDFPRDLEYLTFWANRADEIRRRDRVCQRCGKSARENGRALDVHHIIPYRFSQDNSHSNLIALCRSCHKIVEGANPQ